MGDIVNLFLRSCCVSLALVIAAPALASEQAVARPDRDILSISLDDARADDEPELTPEMARALKDYDRCRLVRRPLQITTTYVTNGYTTGTSVSMTWVVMTGGGSEVTGIGFADMLGDDAMLTQMETERRKGKTAFGVFLGTGIPMIIGGAILIDEFIGESLAAGIYGGGHPGMAGGVALLATGITFASICYIPLVVPLGKQKWVAFYYSPEETDRMIDEYNAEVREELGLSETDVLMLDMFGRRPRVEITPVFGGNYLGIVGRF